MAILVYLRKESESASHAHYRFHTVDGPERSLVLDKESGTIRPDDGRTDGVFRAAARKLAAAWRDGKTPDRLVYAA
jgi:hypothetical protein